MGSVPDKKIKIDFIMRPTDKTFKGLTTVSSFHLDASFWLTSSRMPKGKLRSKEAE